MLKRILIVFWSSLITISVSAQLDTNISQSDLNRLTIYVIPSKVKYDWSSPSALYKSFVRNYKRSLFCKNNYLLGHAFMELESAKLDEDILTGMRSASRKEQKELLLKEGYGLSILGADLAGRLESSADLKKIKDKYSRNGKLAFMTFIISDAATDRMLSFFKSYRAGIDSTGPDGARYGGAFWPRYKGEGAGCSAFVVCFLDLAGILQDEFEEWLVRVNIPMALIGGPFNDNQMVRMRDIRKCDSWAVDNGTTESRAGYYQIYDPYLMFDWINEKWETISVKDNSAVTPLLLNDARGIMIDSRNQHVPVNDPVFMERTEPSIFIHKIDSIYLGPDK